MKHGNENDHLLTAQEAAAYLGLTPRFLEMRRFNGNGPPHIRISSRCVRYLMSDLQAWVEELRRTSTSDSGPLGVGKESRSGLNAG